MNTILRRFSVAGMALVTALSAGNAFAYGAGDVFTHFGVAKVSPKSDNGHFDGLNMDVDVKDDVIVDVVEEEEEAEEASVAALRARLSCLVDVARAHGLAS